jgi:hypothetical protein
MKLAIIDADSLIYYNMSGDSIQECINGLLEAVSNICVETGSTHYVLYLTGHDCFRYDIAKTKPYKGNRRGEEDKPPMFFALKHYMLYTLGAVISPKLEADDMVALHRNKILATKNNDCVIAAIDKDVLCQIPGRHWNYQKSEFVNTTEDEAERFLWTQTITGDSTDNIQGIPRVGPAGAEKILDHDYAAETLTAYVEKFGPRKGVLMFDEMFQLVAIVQDEELCPVKPVYAEPALAELLPKPQHDASDFEAIEDDIDLEDL